MASRLTRANPSPAIAEQYSRRKKKTSGPKSNALDILSFICSSCYAIYCTSVHSLSLADRVVRSEGGSSECIVHALPQPSSTRKLLRVPNHTQHTHRLSLIRVCGQRSFLSRLAIFSKPKRESCLGSTDRAPRHGDHDVRSHGLD